MQRRADRVSSCRASSHRPRRPCRRRVEQGPRPPHAGNGESIHRRNRTPGIAPRAGCHTCVPTSGHSHGAPPARLLPGRVPAAEPARRRCRARPRALHPQREPAGAGGGGRAAALPAARRRALSHGGGALALPRRPAVAACGELRPPPRRGAGSRGDGAPGRRSAAELRRRARDKGGERGDRGARAGLAARPGRAALERRRAAGRRARSRPCASATRGRRTGRRST